MDMKRIQKNIDLEGRDLVYKPKLAYHFLYNDCQQEYLSASWQFLILLSGAAKIKLDDKEIICKEGEALIIKPFEKCSYKSEEGETTYLLIAFNNPFFKSQCFNLDNNLVNLFTIQNEIRLVYSDSEISKILNYFSRYKEVKSNENKILLNTKLLTLNIISKISESYAFKDQKNNGWIEDLLVQINLEENVKWNVDDVLSHSFYSHTHLIRLFKKYTGLTLKQYLVKNKIRVACEKLVFDDISIKELSTFLGYDSQNNFITLFNNAIGMSPLQFRKFARNQDDNLC